jgi:site-specific DNA recombinase
VVRSRALRVDAYIRVSRVGGREGESFISPDVQRDQINAWAAMRDATIDQWHTDLDMSGARADRPGLLTALARVERGEIDGVVVARLDRLARSLPVAFDAITRIEDAGGTLIAVSDGIDPQTATGKMARSILLVIAEWYREQVRESWQTARERAVRRGVAVMSTVPTGYRRREDARLEPDPDVAPVVREVFERRAGGASWVQLADFMNERGVPVRHTKHRDARWTGTTVSRLVSGRVYLGESRSGEYVNTRAHEALVSPALWHAAQAARGVAAVRSIEQPALLAGLVRCAGCGYGMYRSTGKGANRSVSVHYRCRGGGSGGRCEHRGFAVAWDLEAMVVREYLHHAEHLATRGSQDTTGLDAALAELAEAEEGLRVFRDDPRVISALGADAFAAGLRERARLVEEAGKLVAAARLPMAGAPGLMELRGIWPDLTTVDRRRLLASALDCVVVAGRGRLGVERVRLCWAGHGPPDLPRRGRRDSRVSPIEFDALPADTRPALPADLNEYR